MGDGDGLELNFETVYQNCCSSIVYKLALIVDD